MIVWVSYTNKHYHPKWKPFDTWIDSRAGRIEFYLLKLDNYKDFDNSLQWSS